MNKIIKVFLLAVVFSACTEKEEPRPIDPESKFIVNGVLDGEPFEFQAGRSSYFMNTAISLDNYGQRWFEGKMESSSDPGSIPSIEFRFRDLNSTQANADPNSTLLPGITGASALDTNEFYRVSFSSSPQQGKTLDSIVWDFGDGSFRSGLDPIHDYLVADIYYNVIATFYYSNGCTSNQSYLLNPSLNGEIGIIFSLDSTGLYKAEATTNGINPVQYNWSLGSGIMGSTSSILFQAPNNISQENICLEVTDALNQKYYTCLMVSYDPLTSCIGNFNHGSEYQLTVSNGPQSERVMELFMTLDGQEWYAQPGSGNLEILSSALFGSNRNGFPTYELDVQGQFLLRNASGQTKALQIINSTIAVASEKP